MSESEKPYTSPPPSYEEAVHEAPPPQAPNGTPPLINNPIYISQPPTSQVTYNSQSQYTRQQQHTHYSPPPPQVDTSYPYYRCPGGMEPLLDLDEILVYTSRGKNPHLLIISQRSSPNRFKINVVPLRLHIIIMYCSSLNCQPMPNTTPPTIKFAIA